MSQDPHHFKTAFQSRTECEDRHQGHTNHPSAFCIAELSADSVVSSSRRASSSSTGEPQLRQTGLRERTLDYSYDLAQEIPLPERAPKPLTVRNPQEKRALRKKEKCENLKAKADFQDRIKETSGTALQLFDGSGPQTTNIGLHQERFDHPSCLIPGAPEQETDTKDGQQIRRWHRATERPLPSSPALNAPTSPHSRLEPGRDLGTSSHPAHQVSNSSHTRQDAQAAGQRQAQESGFLTSQEWQRRPTAFGPGSTKEITHKLSKTTLPVEPIMRAERGSDSDASTLVAETRFNPIAELEGFDGIPLMRGEGYHYPSTLRRNSIPPSDGLGFGAAADKVVQREETLTEETLAGTVRAHVLASGDVARARRGYRGSTSRPFNCDEDDAQLRMCHDIVPDFTPVLAFEEYRIPAFPWQRHPPRRYEETSMGLRQLMVSLCESLYEKDW